MNAIERLARLNEKAEDKSSTEEENQVVAQIEELQKKFEMAMEDDFNTADAIAAIFEMVKAANSKLDENTSKPVIGKIQHIILSLCEVLGMRTEKKEEILDDEIEKLIQERQEARKNKDFKRADEIRDLLLEKGIVLEDTREGVRWKRA